MPLPDFSSERKEKIKAFVEGGEEKKVTSDLPGIHLWDSLVYKHI